MALLKPPSQFPGAPFQMISLLSCSCCVSVGLWPSKLPLRFCLFVFFFKVFLGRENIDVERVNDLGKEFKDVSIIENFKGNRLLFTY